MRNEKGRQSAAFLFDSMLRGYIATRRACMNLPLQ
jgi:hypothetical protein